MSFLCTRHRQNVTAAPAKAYPTWRRLMGDGAKAHKSGDYRQAHDCFGSASEIASLILDKRPLDHKQLHPMDMWVRATHNLSATLNAAGEHAAAENLLRQLHRDLLSLCQLSNKQRHMRVAALACLDIALFSLTSQLGKSGKIGDIYDLISESERVGDATASQLFH
ncbi:hypothetical protein FKG94_03325 [Exilibacterium tricleocarpae]|uniref:Uncharacterized protein n=1 Tax=Exilibacterium tricleocarpae TaxID=2591008 RepID=A0A545U758_9GAMM|nr:hypothetical protein [Exilibacterium tricleocarpae]TQV85233.1 hypothetical protein FKG94_03325 [Exilibacterium tricleocarpae]